MEVKLEMKPHSSSSSPTGSLHFVPFAPRTSGSRHASLSLGGRESRAPWSMDEAVGAVLLSVVSSSSSVRPRQAQQNDQFYSGNP